MLSVILIGISAAAGAALRSPPASVADLDACGLPCWRGITPRETLEADADRLLLARGYRELEAIRSRVNLSVFRPQGTAECSARVSYAGGQVADIALLGCPDVYLGDVMALLGTPDGFIADTILSFAGARAFVSLRADPCADGYRPEMRVQGIFIAFYTFDADGRQNAVERLSTWRGFGSGAFYAAADPGLIDCS
jgi:hypothetical protein